MFRKIHLLRDSLSHTEDLGHDLDFLAFDSKLDRMGEHHVVKAFSGFCLQGLLSHLTQEDAMIEPQTVSPPSLGGFENDKEFKAHIYQQLVDLQPYLGPESHVAVIVQPILESHNESTTADDFSEALSMYSLVLVATFGDYRVEAEGRAESLYVALGEAKRRMLQQLDELYNSAVDSLEREEQINSLLDNRMTIH